MTGYVCHVRECIDGAVYIGRVRSVTPTDRPFWASKWGNPYKIGGTYDFSARPITREEAVAAYRKYLLDRPSLLRLLPNLRDKPLSCWCRRSHQTLDPDRNLCHGDALLEILARHSDEELLAMR